ncbi:MAG: S9 family peptidase [Wenzhouxiangella sp.]|nr:MAG: S9 family peptidase [Wenzhouxiangella sp.]
MTSDDFMFFKLTTHRWAIVGMALLLSLPALARQPLTHDVYTSWNRIQASAISADGQWAWWQMAPEQADGELVVSSTDGERVIRVERGGGAVFSRDSRFVVFQVQPSFDEARQARLDKVPAAERPQPGLGLVDLTSGDRRDYQRVESFALPDESGDWLAWLHGPTGDEQAVDEDDMEDEGPAGGSEEEEKENDEARADKQDPGTNLVIQSLTDERQWQIEHVRHYAWSSDGRYLAATRVSPDGSADALLLVEAASGEVSTLLDGKGRYARPVFSDDGERLAILVRHHDEERAEHAWSLYAWQAGEDRAGLVADEHSAFLEADWHVSQHQQPTFSDSGQRLYFGTAPAPIEPADNEDRLDDEVVRVDIWHWQDPELQSMQLVRLEEERKRSYLAVAHLGDRASELVQLGRREIPDLVLSETGDSPYALGYSNLPYRMEISWDFPRYHDAWRVDLVSGAAEQLASRIQTVPDLSPAGGYAFWWDGEQATWKAYRLGDGVQIDLGAGIASNLADHRNDRPFIDPPYGHGGWMEDDAAFLVYDRFDVWRVDPADPAAAVSLSRGLGAERGWNLRLVDLDPDAAARDPAQPLLAMVFDEASKDHGFVELDIDGQSVRERVMSGHRYGRPSRARDVDSLLFTRENFEEFPDLWISDLAFSDMTRLSEANPQQKDYRWGTAELVEWRSREGRPHQGLLFKPEDFDPGRSYPMIVYFYERDSDGLHRHRPPQAHRSVIIPTFYTSNDYIVFVPDVWYREGYPGDSAMASIMPKVNRLGEEPWVDAGRVGIQGHSWAGYQIAYMITQTDFFRAAAGGAPVANMTSAYGGIRWSTGMSRMFQYERTQSRLGRTLWEAPELYLRNSPLFLADRINTPLLIMHNDKDGAVPWEQGIELFTALRRLGRPSWLINYNSEPHWPTTFANRHDWQVRMQQFFDHYLKDAPAPRWLENGIPALEKGTTLGLETD